MGDAAVRRIAREIATSDVFSRLFRTLDGDEYPGLIKMLLDTWDAPAALVLAASECFPAHFVDQLLVRCEKNECMVRKMPFRTKRMVLRDIRGVNRKALDHWKQVTVIQNDARAQNVSASTLAMDCRMNQQLVDGTQISDLSLTSP